MAQRPQSESDVPPLRAWLLGPTRLMRGSEAISSRVWTGRAARTLLLLLLGTPGQRLPRDRVLDVLWPDTSPDAALNALYKAVHSLRRVLEPDLLAGRTSSYVTIGAESVGLVSLPGTWVDADAFEQALVQAETLTDVERRSALRNALDLYRDDFLADEPYADWPVARRESLRRARERAVLSLAMLDLDAGDPLESIPALEALLTADSTAEEAYRAMIRAYAAAGQRDQALRQVARCQAALERELGAEPAPETVALARLVEEMPSAPSPLSVVSHVGPRQPFNNLPASPTPTVGRAGAIEEVQTLLWRPDVRLVTLTGAGGIGKTRLAIESASALVDDFADGVAFVPLAPLRDPSLLLATIARTLDVRESAAQTVDAALRSLLRERELLLVLDNFEQILAAGPAVVDLLASCHRLKVLATSRAVLRVRGEHEYRVALLDRPNLDRLPSTASLARYDAVTLFLQTIRTGKPDFALTEANARAVAELTVRLDGLPLAIELAAARGQYLSPERLLDQIKRKLTTLASGPRDLPERQQTLRATVAWSHDLLSEEEQVLFRRLAVFLGGAEVDAVVTVCGDDGHDTESILQALCEKSLLQWEERAGSARVSMLETILSFAQEQLTLSGEDDDVRSRHAAYFLDLAARAGPALSGPEQGMWLDRLEDDHANLRAALAWGLEHNEVETSLRLCGALSPFWRRRGYLTEGRAWLARALALDGVRNGAARARALNGAGMLAALQGDHARAVEYLDDALAAWRTLGDTREVARTLSDLSFVARENADFDGAMQLTEQALVVFQAAGDQSGVAESLDRLGTSAIPLGRHEEAAAFYERSLALYRALGDQLATARVINNLGIVKLGQQRFEEAKDLYAESLALSRRFDDKRGIANALLNLGEVLRFLGDVDQGADLAAEAVVRARELVDRHTLAAALFVHGSAMREHGDRRRAVEELREALSLYLETGDKLGVAWCLEALAGVATDIGQPEPAARLLGGASGLREIIRGPVQPWEEPAIRITTTRARAALGDEAFDETRDAGRKRTLDEIVAEAKDILGANSD